MSIPGCLRKALALPYLRYLVRAADGLEKWGLRAEEIQLGLLATMLELNSGSEFVQAHGLKGVEGYKDFVKRIPITDYESYRPYVERMAEGNSGALLGRKEKLQMFALTSGTTGQPKQIPVGGTFLRNYRRGWKKIASLVYRDHPEVWYRQIFQLASPADDYRTSGGIPCGAISGLTAQMQNWFVRSHYAVPPGVCNIGDTDDRYYTAVRMAIDKDVALIVTASPATLVSIARKVQGRSEELIRDVRDGTLSAKCEMPSELRGELSAGLRPNADLARKLERRGADEGLLPRDYWRISLVSCWLGGTMGLYIPQLRELYGDVVLRDIGLLASEGRMSIPLSDETPDGMLDIDSNFYEFIPVDQMDGWTGPALLGHELEVGKKYFILLTTPSGFFRYNISDVVEVSGYVGGAPMIRFLNKGTRISSIVGEKLSEHNVVQAIARIYRESGQNDQCFDVVLCPQWGDPPFYRLNIDREAFAGLDSEAVRTELGKRLDQVLMAVNVEYKSKRKSDRLGPVEVRVLAAGYLAECDRQGMARSVTARSQFKHRYLHTELGADTDFPVCKSSE